MATNNSINNTSNPLASTALSVDPGASGDSTVSFLINTAAKFTIGSDDDAGDAFKIAASSALGTTDTFVMTTAGEQTMPLQPAFFGNLGSTDANETGDGTTFTLGSTTALTEIFDQGGDFNTNGTFTAPVTGRYFLYAAVLAQQAVSTMTAQISLVSSNRTYTFGAYSAVDTGNFPISISTLVDMDAGDTCTATVTFGSGTLVVDIFGNSGIPRTYFCGYLAF